LTSGSSGVSFVVESAREMSTFLRMLGFGGPKKAELVRATIVRTNYRLQKDWAAFLKEATPGLEALAANAGSSAPQVVVQMKSEHEGANFVLTPAGSKSEPAKLAHSHSSVVEACMLPGSASTAAFDGFCWKWSDAPGTVQVTVTSTCFDIREGSFEAFVAQFATESHQLRPHAAECGILWQAAFESSPSKVTLLSTFQKGADGPKRMGPRLPELYSKMGLAQFLTAKPLIDTSEHGSYLLPVDCDGISVSA